MGIEIGTLAAIASIASAGMSIVGGFQGQAAGNDQAEIAAQQAEARAVEQERLSAKEARVEQEEAESLARRQKVAFLASGVDLSGSPLLLMEETRRKGAENVGEIMQAGAAGAGAARAEGRQQAEGFKAQGRQAFMSGLSKGVSTGVRAFV